QVGLDEAAAGLVGRADGGLEAGPPAGGGGGAPRPPGPRGAGGGGGPGEPALVLGREQGIGPQLGQVAASEVDCALARGAGAPNHGFPPETRRWLSVGERDAAVWSFHGRT